MGQNSILRHYRTPSDSIWCHQMERDVWDGIWSEGLIRAARNQSRRWCRGGGGLWQLSAMTASRQQRAYVEMVTTITSALPEVNPYFTELEHNIFHHYMLLSVAHSKQANEQSGREDSWRMSLFPVLKLRWALLPVVNPPAIGPKCKIKLWF